MKKNCALVVLGLLAVVAGSVSSRAADAPAALKDAFKNDFLIGAAINQAQFSGTDHRGDAIIESQFNSITPENVLKWESVHPGLDKYDFDGPDKYVAFGEKNHMYIIGHTLVWHNQTPAWVFQDTNGQPVTRDVLLQRMHDHISTVVGRYKGRIKGWDVVNEAIDQDGSMRKSPWEKIIGDDYVEKAFQFAHEADPDAKLHYNEYWLENFDAKRKATVALIKKLQSEGVKVDCIGLQCHVKLAEPTPKQVDNTISEFAALGIKVMITELDVDVLPVTQRFVVGDYHSTGDTTPGGQIYANGLPDAQQQELANRYADLFRVFVKHRADITRVTFWGVTDGDSWLNMHGRVQYPLLFDRNGQPKPAFYAVLKEAGQR